MSWKRDVLGRSATYLHTSPIARLMSWAMGQRPASSDDNRSERLSLGRAEQITDERSIANKERPETSTCKEFHPYDSTCARCVAADCADGKTHNWPLGRRIFIAAVISWYT
jgi:hypothetical protein